MAPLNKHQAPKERLNFLSNKKLLPANPYPPVVLSSDLLLKEHAQV